MLKIIIEHPEEIFSYLNLVIKAEGIAKLSTYSYS